MAPYQPGCEICEPPLDSQGNSAEPPPDDIGK